MRLVKKLPLLYLLMCVVPFKGPATYFPAFGLAFALGTDDRGWTFRCPCKCNFDTYGRKRVICDEGSRDSIPTTLMDRGTQVLVFSAPPNAPNGVSIGRIFQQFDHLEEIYITYSQVPAIGDSSFWPGKRLYHLDLSHNRIDIIREKDFNGLMNLGVLNLSDNYISSAPSAPFRFLTNLTRLSVARNKLTKLVPRLFYKLEKLEHLDLSGNPLAEIHPDDIKDVRGLRTLYLAGCHLKKFHSLVYQGLTQLEQLDLRENRFTTLVPEEFKHLKKLRSLLLDGNRLTLISDHTFDGHSLEVLGLARNSLASISTCGFCNSSIKRLDMSRNKFKFFQPKLLEPLSSSVTTVNVEENNELKEPSSSASNLIKPLRVLKILSIAGMALDDSLPDDLFSNHGETLESLDMSGNRLVNISGRLFQPLQVLKELDLSRNEIYGLSKAVIGVLDSMSSLVSLYLQDNPWSCYRCHVLSLLDWIKSSPRAYQHVCREGDGFCVKCSIPAELKGQDVHAVGELDLEWCADPTIQLRLSASEPRVGFVLAMLIIISLLIVIVTVVIIYRKQGATYYTHEDERLDEKTIFTIEQVAKATASPPLSPPPISTPGSTSPPMSPPPSSPPSSSPPRHPPPPPPPPPPPLPEDPTSGETKPKVRI